MKVTGVMVIVYISCCIRVATRPCKYFQLNARFFDSREGIFSKMAIDRLIPPRWRLAQRYDDAHIPRLMDLGILWHQLNSSSYTN